LIAGSTSRRRANWRVSTLQVRTYIYIYIYIYILYIYICYMYTL